MKWAEDGLGKTRCETTLKHKMFVIHVLQLHKVNYIIITATRTLVPGEMTILLIFIIIIITAQIFHGNFHIIVGI